MNTNHRHGNIRINTANVPEAARADHDSLATHITLELLLPEGCVAEDIWVEPKLRDQLLDESELAITVEDSVLVVSGPIQWFGAGLDSEPNELLNHFRNIESELSSIVREEVDLDLEVGGLRHVTYKIDRGLESEESLRDLLDYWRVHLRVIPSVSRYPEYGHGPVKVKYDDYFGYFGGDVQCELRFSWVPVSDDNSRPLLRFEVHIGADELMSALEHQKLLNASDAAKVAEETIQVFLSHFQVRETPVVEKAAHLGMLMTPWILYYGGLPMR